jgi:hypothetical protein
MATQIQLLPGEEVAFEIDADVLRAGTDPVAQLIARIGVFFAKIFGHKEKAKLIVTTKRVVQVTHVIDWYCIPKKTLYQVIMPSSVKEVGYYVQTACCGMMKSFRFYYQGLTESSAFDIKGGNDKILADYVAKFYAALNS